MNNIDFIKWMCEKAEGFDYSFVTGYSMKQVLYKYKNKRFAYDAYYFKERSQLYPLLLQRAIEHINSSDDYCYFIQLNIYSICIESVDTGSELIVIDYNDPDYPIPANSQQVDQAKESALMYIYELECGK